MILHLVTLIAAGRRRIVREDGAIALATLAFMMVTGLIAIVTLWTIGYSTSAYNKLYAGTQAAAYAAVGRTLESTPGGSAQLNFDCAGPGMPERNESATACGGGQAFGVVEQTLSRAFAGGQYGLSYANGNGGSVKLVDENFNDWNAIYAYYIPVPAGTARAIVAGRGCPFTESLGGQPARLLCWAVLDAGAGNTPQYTSGVIVRTRTTVNMPGCALDICAPLELTVTAAASVAQAPQGSY